MDVGKGREQDAEALFSHGARSPRMVTYYLYAHILRAPLVGAAGIVPCSVTKILFSDRILGCFSF